MLVSSRPGPGSRKGAPREIVSSGGIVVYPWLTGLAYGGHDLCPGLRRGVVRLGWRCVGVRRGTGVVDTHGRTIEHDAGSGPGGARTAKRTDRLAERAVARTRPAALRGGIARDSTGWKDRRGVPGETGVAGTLWVRGRGEEDRELVRDAAVAHYGAPDLDQPAWCRLDGAGEHCRADAPSLVFQPVVGAAGELVLTGPVR
jgi:hypothetical protein